MAEVDANPQATSVPFSVLIVDDDDVATEGVLRSLRKSQINCAMVTAEDGLEALEVLRGQNPQKSIDEPMIILLDLNMPRMNGFEFLEALRADNVLRSKVVFVLTTSARDADMARAYAENVAGYMVKSSVGPQFSRLASFLGKYAESVKLPGAHRAV